MLEHIYVVSQNGKLHYVARRRPGNNGYTIILTATAAEIAKTVVERLNVMPKVRTRKR